MFLLKCVRYFNRHSDKCDGRTQEESIGDDVGDAISHEMDGCNETVSIRGGKINFQSDG